MKNLMYSLCALIIVLIINVQSTNAQLACEKEIKIDKYSKSLINGELKQSNKVTLALEESLENKHINLMRQIQIMTLPDTETEQKIENWMISVTADIWRIDIEESIQLEPWMFDPCNWIFCN